MFSLQSIPSQATEKNLTSESEVLVPKSDQSESSTAELTSKVFLVKCLKLFEKLHLIVVCSVSFSDDVVLQSISSPQVDMTCNLVPSNESAVLVIKSSSNQPGKEEVISKVCYIFL